jgi:hypothetical protein
MLDISVRIVIVFSSSLMIMLSPTLLANVSYAQLPETSTPSPAVPQSTLPDGAVTITSPEDGQRVPVGQDLEVRGTSMANAASDCKISCGDDPNAKQFAHVNVTGVATSSLSSSVSDMPR